MSKSSVKSIHPVILKHAYRHPERSEGSRLETTRSFAALRMTDLQGRDPSPFGLRMTGCVILLVMLLCAHIPVAAGAKRDSAREFQMPFAQELWVASLRWNDVSRYHFGPQEFFDGVTWPDPPLCIFVGTHAGQLSCLDATYGFTRWQKDLGHPLINSMAIHEGYGYVLSQDGVLFKLGLTTGNLFWQEDFSVAVVAKILVDTGGLYFLTASSELWKYNPLTREVAWKYQDEIFQKLTFMGGTQPLRSKDGKTIVIGVPNGGIVALKDEDGAIAWEHTLSVKSPIDDVDATPVELDDGSWLVSSVDSTTQHISAQGELIHTWPFGSPRGGVLLSEGGVTHFLQPSLGAIRLVDSGNRSVVQRVDVPIEWGYPQRPVFVVNNLYVIVFSQGPAIALHAKSFRYEVIREPHTGFSAAPLALNEEGDVILYSNYANVTKIHVDVDRLERHLQ